MGTYILYSFPGPGFMYKVQTMTATMAMNVFSGIYNRPCLFTNFSASWGHVLHLLPRHQPCCLHGHQQLRHFLQGHQQDGSHWWASGQQTYPGFRDRSLLSMATRSRMGPTVAHDLLTHKHILDPMLLTALGLPSFLLGHFSMGLES